MIYLAWKVLGTSQSFSLTGKACHPKCFISIFYDLRSSTSTNPYFPPWRAFLLLMQFLFWIWVSIFSYKAPTKGHYDRTWDLGVANMRVCFMNGSMIEHNGLGRTCFSVDILKDMVACWYAWVLKSSCQNLTIALNHIKVQMSMLQNKRICDEHVRQHSTSKFYFYHLPTRGRAGIKLGDADTSPTYL